MISGQIIASRLTLAGGMGQMTIIGMIACRILTEATFHPRARAKDARAGRAKAKEASEARLVQSRMKKRHGQENKVRKMMGRRRMKAIALRTGMREMQRVGCG